MVPAEVEATFEAAPKKESPPDGLYRDVGTNEVGGMDERAAA